MNIHTYGLSPSQTRAFEEIRDWYNNTTSNTHVLSGYAGTGKTFLINRLVKYVFPKNICVTAPTHRALRILENMTGLKGMTIHKLNGLRPNMNLDDFKIDRLKFDKTGEQHLRKFKIICVDESSMLNSDLEKLMTNNAKAHNVKILYIGDPCQLPPISERSSPVFQRHTISNLTDIMRQKDDNPIKDLLDVSRMDVLNQSFDIKKFLEVTPFAINANNEGYRVLFDDKFQNDLILNFNSAEFGEDVSFVRYLGFTNDSIAEYNKFIRSQTVMSNKIITTHDLLTGYKTIVDNYNNPILINSEDYVITDIVERLSDYKFKVFQCTLMQVGTGIKTKTNIVDHTDESFLQYVYKITDLINETVGKYGSERGMAYKRYFNFKDQNLTMVDFEVIDMDDSVHRVYKELDYGYGITVHKAQGSTIKNPFINLINMVYYKNMVGSLIKNTNTRPDAGELRNRLVYTALTRTSQQATLLF